MAMIELPESQDENGFTVYPQVVPSSPRRYLNDSFESSSIGLPLWLALFGLALASLWLVQHFLLPSARWILRRRANRLIDEFNSHLALSIPSFKLTQRTVLVDRLSYHPRVIELVGELARKQDIPARTTTTLLMSLCAC